MRWGTAFVIGCLFALATVVVVHRVSLRQHRDSRTQRLGFWLWLIMAVCCGINGASMYPGWRSIFGFSGATVGAIGAFYHALHSKRGVKPTR
jgi:hypothetical protein